MPRKKEKIISLEVIEPNSTWSYIKERPFYNFICKKDEAEDILKTQDRRGLTGNMKQYESEVKSILAPSGTRNSSSVFFGNEVGVEEVSLSPKTLTGAKYVYKIYDYTGEKMHTEYGVQKEAIAYITKRIRSKYAYITHDGIEERIEYNPKQISELLTGLEFTTSQLEIAPSGRTGPTNDILLVSVFRNLVMKER